MAPFNRNVPPENCCRNLHRLELQWHRLKFLWSYCLESSVCENFSFFTPFTALITFCLMFSSFYWMKHFLSENAPILKELLNFTNFFWREFVSVHSKEIGVFYLHCTTIFFNISRKSSLRLNGANDSDNMAIVPPFCRGKSTEKRIFAKNSRKTISMVVGWRSGQWIGTTEQNERNPTTSLTKNNSRQEEHVKTFWFFD